MCVFVVGTKGLLFNARLSARTTPVMLTALTTPTHTHSTTRLIYLRFQETQKEEGGEGEKKRGKKEKV